MDTAMDLLRSLPIGLYLEQPVTWLHHLDPRVKLGWLMTFLLAPILANNACRIALVGLLIILTLTARIPWRAWKQQMGWLLIVAGLAFVITCIFDDGLALTSQPRLIGAELSDITATGYQFGDYRDIQPTPYDYVVLSVGRITVTRHSLDLATRFTTLLFTLVYSTSLYLLVTAPEEITTGLEQLLDPLNRFKIPITEILLTLTLALRFIPLVLEEVQNLTRSVRTRAINWKKIGLKQTIQIWLVVAERLIENLLLRAEQIALAMNVRGFTAPNEHRVQWHRLQLRWGDGVAIALLILLWWARLTVGWMV
nr:CbiQ family ECF transporter T component [Spirulina subsalsa]